MSQAATRSRKTSPPPAIHTVPRRWTLEWTPVVHLQVKTTMLLETRHWEGLLRALGMQPRSIMMIRHMTARRLWRTHKELEVTHSVRPTRRERPPDHMEPETFRPMSDKHQERILVTTSRQLHRPLRDHMELEQTHL